MIGPSESSIFLKLYFHVSRLKNASSFSLCCFAPDIDTLQHEISKTLKHSPSFMKYYMHAMETLKSRTIVTNTSLHHTTPHHTIQNKLYKKHYQFSKLKPESAVRINWLQLSSPRMRKIYHLNKITIKLYYTIIYCVSKMMH